MNKSRVAVSLLIRISIIVGISLFYNQSQDIISRFKAELEGKSHKIIDLTHKISTEWNQYILDHKMLSDFLIMSSSGILDLFYVIVIFLAVFYTLRPFLGLAIVLVLRQFCQAITGEPIPSHIIWYAPPFPSLTVDYDIANDFFFSAHTATSLYMGLILSKYFIGKYRFWYVPPILLSVYFMVLVPTLRVHYFMDVYAGFVTAVMVFLLITRVKMPAFVDRGILADIRDIKK